MIRSTLSLIAFFCLLASAQVQLIPRTAPVHEVGRPGAKAPVSRMLPARAAAGVAPITPTAASTPVALWLKADAITVLADGGAASTFPDSSGNAHSCTSASNNPTFETNEINGKPVLRGSTAASTTWYSCTGGTVLNLLRSVAGATIFAVVRPNISSGFTTSNVPINISKGTANTARANQIFTQGSTNTRRYSIQTSTLDADGVSGTSGVDNTFTNGTTGLFTGLYSYSTDFNASYANGALIDSRALSSSAAGNTSDTASMSVTVGHSAVNANTRFQGDIAEVVVFPAALSEADRKGVEAYLACKYALSLVFTVTCS